ncbi:hypothetical protein ABZ946_04210 [Streptomyces sp. NPDC046324]|uniref:hypothetical protein n=1 Tax=Streptomyces sp. NPDC046324 TaxID=3154915 RepID=UPI003404F3B5
MLGIASKLQAMLTDPEHIVSTPVTPHAYQAKHLNFTPPRDAVQENTLAEFSELVNRIPTSPIWQPSTTVHLWDIYGEMLGADLARSSLATDEERDYGKALDYLYDTGPDGNVAASQALRDYQTASHAWLQASIDYKQAQQTASMSTDPAIRTRWQEVDEPRLRQVRDDALTAWMGPGRKNEVEEELRTVTELGAKMPSAVWRRHRETFNPKLPDQFSTAPNGSRFVPTFYAPGEVLDVAWPRVELSREMLVTLSSQASPALTAALGGTIDDDIHSVVFDYCPVSIARPWFDPVMDLFGSRAWRFPSGVQPLSDGADPPRGRCPTFVESVALVRNIETVRLSGNELSSGEAFLEGDPEHAYASIDLDTGSREVGVPDLSWDSISAGVPQLRSLNDASFYLANSTDFDALRPARLYRESEPPHRPFGEGYLRAAEGYSLTGTLMIFRTTEANIAKVQVLESGSYAKIRWATYKVGRDSTISDPEDIYIAAFTCRRLSRCPDPDPMLPW